MTDEQFETLVNKLEAQAQNQPFLYQLKVILLALLGNAYIGVMLLFIIILFLSLLGSILVLKLLAVKLIIVVGFFLWMILKALWVSLEPPEGSEVKAKQAPELFSMIKNLRRQLRAPRFHHVLVTNDFNAAVVQSPRLGIFGWPRNYLLIGLPLLKSLTVEQFKAVLAHEFGHLAKGHGRMSNWIYRQRLRWARLLAVLSANKSKGSFLFKPFLNWFTPYFNAFSFPMARANEYEADATSARLTSAQTTAEALSTVNIVGSYLEERYWPQIHKQADELPAPSFSPYHGMAHGVATDLDQDSAQAWLEQSMARQTDSTDTHPALSDRLKALNEPPRLALPAIGQAADKLLGDSLVSITESFDHDWKENILPSWEQHYHAIQNDRHQLSELNKRFEDGAELSIQEAFDRAILTETAGKDNDAALAQLRTLHQIAPDDPQVCFSLGARLLNINDDNGSTLIEHAMQLDENAIVNGCEVLRDYHWHNGRKEEAEAWHQRMVDRLQIHEAANDERNRILLSDKFEPHGLSNDVLAALQTQLRQLPRIRKAYLVKKRVKHLAHLPLYVFGYRVTGFLRFHSKRRVQEVLQQIQESVQFPGETIIINVEGNNYRFGRKFRWLRGARIL